jgi:hypothetical protein
VGLRAASPDEFLQRAKGQGDLFELLEKSAADSAPDQATTEAATEPSADADGSSGGAVALEQRAAAVAPSSGLHRRPDDFDDLVVDEPMVASNERVPETSDSGDGSGARSDDDLLPGVQPALNREGEQEEKL